MKANTKKTGNTITLDEGLETFNLVFKGRDEAVAITFNPKDHDLLVRTEKAVANITKALSEIPDDDTAENREKAREFVCNEIDYIFASKISDKVFKNCSPLTSYETGETFVERFLAAVAPYIRQRIDAAEKASLERIKKHTDKYTK